MQGVGFHGTGSDHQLHIDLGIGHSYCHQSKNFLFSGRQELLVRRLRPCLCRGAKCMLGRGCDRVNGARCDVQELVCPTAKGIGIRGGMLFDHDYCTHYFNAAPNGASATGGHELRSENIATPTALLHCSICRRLKSSKRSRPADGALTLAPPMPSTWACLKSSKRCRPADGALTLAPPMPSTWA